MSAHYPQSPKDFQIVFVCTGNRARSPFAAEFLRRHYGTVSVVTTSRGLLDLEGVPALPEAVWAAREFDVDLTSHRARQLREQELESTDLVIGFESQHVAAAVVTGGAARERTFLISELAELVGGPQGRALGVRLPPTSAIRRAHEGRSGLALLPRSIADPVGAPKEEFLATFDRISRTVAAIGVALFESEDE